MEAGFIGGGGRTRTYDLWVMSPTSYHCSTPRCFTGAKLLPFSDMAKFFGKNISTFQVFWVICAINILFVPMSNCGFYDSCVEHSDSSRIFSPSIFAFLTPRARRRSARLTRLVPPRVRLR